MKLSEELKDKLRDDIPLSHSDIIRLSQLEAELEDRCATIDAIENGKGIDYLMTALAETNRLLREEREQLQQTQAELASRELMDAEGDSFAEDIVAENQRLREERDALVRWMQAHEKISLTEAMMLENHGVDTDEFYADCLEAWKAIPEAARKEIECT